MQKNGLRHGKRIASFVARGDGVFIPTGTSELLVAACMKVLQSPQKLLDLGCGSGFVGLTLAQNNRCKPPLYASDISSRAVAVATENAQMMGVECTIRQGSLFTPWAGEQFDCIVSDVAGIADAIAAVSPWYPPGVSCDAGHDGTKWVVQIVEQASSYLKAHGMFVFPVLSLSNEQRILDVVARSFASWTMIAQQDWFLPESIVAHQDVLTALLADGSIRCEKKFGAWIWSTRIYQATNGRSVE